MDHYLVYVRYPIRCRDGTGIFQRAEQGGRTNAYVRHGSLMMLATLPTSNHQLSDLYRPKH